MLSWKHDCSNFIFCFLNYIYGALLMPFYCKKSNKGRNTNLETKTLLKQVKRLTKRGYDYDLSYYCLSNIETKTLSYYAGKLLKNWNAEEMHLLEKCIKKARFCSKREFFISLPKKYHAKARQLPATKVAGLHDDAGRCSPPWHRHTAYPDTARLTEFPQKQCRGRPVRGRFPSELPC